MTSTKPKKTAKQHAAAKRKEEKASEQAEPRVGRQKRPNVGARDADAGAAVDAQVVSPNCMFLLMKYSLPFRAFLNQKNQKK
jgi:hypothetical protein